MEYLLILLGVFVGSIVTLIVEHIRSAHGTLRIDHTDPEKDIYRIEINNLDELSKKKQAILSIDNNAVIFSQE